MNEISLFRCLAEGTRFTIVQALSQAPDLCVSELVELTGKEQTNVSHHLAELRGCGLVVAEQRGRHVHYALAHPRLSDLVDEAAWLTEHIPGADPQACMEAGCC